MFLFLQLSYPECSYIQLVQGLFVNSYYGFENLPFKWNIIQIKFNSTITKKMARNSHALG